MTMPGKMKANRKASGRGLFVAFLFAAAAWGLASSGRLFVSIRNEPNMRSRRSQRTDRNSIEAAAVEQKPVEIGDTLTGTVTEVSDGHALIDVGRKVPAFVVKCDIREEWTDKVSDVLAVGDSIAGRVLSVKTREGIQLAIKERPEFSKRPLSEFSAGDEIEGEVVGLAETRRTKKPVIYFDIGAMLNAHAVGKAGQNIEAGIEKGMKVKVKVNKVSATDGIQVVPV
eukprot:TRINITY_DN12848_c0_g1_i2.p1 TRINITY_DN12848_c0_g1~~TRINITY_DN12848_c0_g1_i2.p1  ORF type:complete len:227 (-),score=42.13 TRINITY_DN12848_c0_g1_i2:126-806(-)